MSDRLKITFTGGDEIGDEVECEFAERLLVGRSHTADIRVREPDVSGRHLELYRKGNAVFAHNVSRYPAVVDGRTLSTGEDAELHVQSTVELGRNVRFRVDRLPHADGESRPEAGAGTHATRAVAGETEATVFGESETFATRVVETAGLPSSPGESATGRVEESATRDVASFFSEAQRTLADFSPALSTAKPDPADGETVAVADAAAEADTADDVVTDDAETLLHGLDDSPPPAAPDAAATLVADATVTGEDQTNDGETQEMVTRVGSFEEIIERRHQLDRAAAARHWRFGIGVVLCLAALGGVWFVSMNRRHLTDAEGPFLPNGDKDIAETEIVGADGRPELFLEYPRDDRMQVVKAAGGDEFEVSSCLGRDRDVPFRLWFKKVLQPVELELSLEESFDRWMQTMSKDKGFSFERTRGGNPLPLEFFDSVFDGYCERVTLSGVPFMRTDYSRTVGHAIWRGICYRIRCGDVAYSVCCEIPDAFWERGESRLRNCPFFGLYAAFIDRHWDSPGKAGLVAGISEDELMTLVRKEMSTFRPSSWPTVEKWIDTLLVKTWGRGTMSAKAVVESRDSLLAKKTGYYNERQLSFETARTDGDVRRMRSIFSDCLQVFGASKRDRRYYLINDPNVWRCKWSR